MASDSKRNGLSRGTDTQNSQPVCSNVILPFYIELAGTWPNGRFERYHFAAANCRVRQHPFVQRLIRDGGDVYRSIAEYPNACRSVEHRCPIGVFDIDCDSDLERARVEAWDCVRYFAHKLDVSHHDIWVTFSGNKGFHILLSDELFGDTATQATIETWHGVATDLKQEIAPSIDTSIYRHGALIRCPNTLNTKSGRYDIPLEAAELEGMSADAIRDLAIKPRDENPWPTPDFSDSARFWLIDRVAEPERPKPKRPRVSRKGGWHTPPCVRKAEKVVLPDGCRHETLHSLGRFYFSVGMAPDEIVDRLFEIDARHPIRDPDYIPRMVDCVVKKPGFYGCPNPGLTPFCVPDNCPLKRLGGTGD